MSWFPDELDTNRLSDTPAADCRLEKLLRCHHEVKRSREINTCRRANLGSANAHIPDDYINGAAVIEGNNLSLLHNLVAPEFTLIGSTIAARNAPPFLVDLVKQRKGMGPTPQAHVGTIQGHPELESGRPQ